MATRLPLRFIPRPSAVRPALGPAEQEAARLRQLMAEMLAGLEALRALLAREG
jgi:hypothetical protein